MRFHLHRSLARRVLGMAVLPAALVLVALAAAPAAADDGDPTPPRWEDKTYSWHDDEMPVDFPEGGGGPALSLVLIDAEKLNVAVAAAQGDNWDVPSFEAGRPMLLWGGGGGGGFNSLRFGGFGAGGELTVDDSGGTSQFSLGYGGARFQYVIRPGVGRGETYPGGRLRFTLGGLVGGGGYELKLTDKRAEPTNVGRDYPIHRSASQGFVLLAPEVGMELSLTPVNHLVVSASYLYPVTLGSSNDDPGIRPDPAVIQNLSVTVALMFGLF
ncbi:hypothetical protein LIP_2431 [Limnochorda pilosa]|uniref:Outer membrane protein beta-barrel domain-containing protein n=2 Tax=Limnochorda pilosa TaxID=1555112 RepID=A0A0K2SMP4_LIMPI|nr:hypothetical protein LIP_2431 [Limnochorda pilosa]